MEKHEICRIVIKGDKRAKLKTPLGKGSAIFLSAMNQLAEQYYQQCHFNFVITPGGILSFKFPKTLDEKWHISTVAKKSVTELISEANKAIVTTFKSLSHNTFKKLQSIGHFLTIGIDGSNSFDQTIELVAIFDLEKAKVIHWTGKSYPAPWQWNHLIKINDIDSHFLELNKERVLVLGCHDLALFSARSKATRNPGGEKDQIAKKILRKSRAFKPTIVLHHPHRTYSPMIWAGAWSGLSMELSSVRTYASAINYAKMRDNNALRPLDKVLDKTHLGDIVDLICD